MQPSSCDIIPLHSGQTHIMVSLSIKSELVNFFKTCAIASGQERTILPSCHAGEGHRMPVSCFTIASIFTPDRNVREIMRPATSFNHVLPITPSGKSNVLFLNPGTAGPFRAPITVALLHLRGSSLDAELVELNL